MSLSVTSLELKPPQRSDLEFVKTHTEVQHNHRRGSDHETAEAAHRVDADEKKQLNT